MLSLTGKSAARIKAVRIMFSRFMAARIKAARFIDKFFCSATRTGGRGRFGRKGDGSVFLMLRLSVFCVAFLSCVFSQLIVVEAGKGKKTARRKCKGARYDCVRKKPREYDKKIRVIKKPRRGYDRACLKRLKNAGVKFRLLARVKGVRTPVEILSKRLGGVRYIKHWNNKRRFILDCRFAEALVVRGRRIRLAGIASVYYSSSWRYTYRKGTKKLSKHASGKALDITAIDGSFGYASVIKHYEKGRWGCGSRNKTKKGKAWRQFYCALMLNNGFKKILTPDSGRAHRDHLHLEGIRSSMRLKRKK